MPLAAGTAHGSAFQEAAIMVVAYSSGPTGLISLALILWGLRIQAVEQAGTDYLIPPTRFDMSAP